MVGKIRFFLLTCKSSAFKLIPLNIFKCQSIEQYFITENNGIEQNQHTGIWDLILMVVQKAT